MIMSGRTSQMYGSGGRTFCGFQVLGTDIESGMPQLRRRPPQIIRMTLAFCLGAIGWVARGVGTQSDYPELTNVIQLRSIQAEDRFNYRIDLAADVWWAEPATHRLVVHDVTGSEEVEIVRAAGGGSVA